MRPQEERFWYIPVRGDNSYSTSAIDMYRTSLTAPTATEIAIFIQKRIRVISASVAISVNWGMLAYTESRRNWHFCGPWRVVFFFRREVINHDVKTLKATTNSYYGNRTKATPARGSRTAARESASSVNDHCMRWGPDIFVRLRNGTSYGSLTGKIHLFATILIMIIFSC